MPTERSPVGNTTEPVPAQVTNALSVSPFLVLCIAINGAFHCLLRYMQLVLAWFGCGTCPIRARTIINRRHAENRCGAARLPAVLRGCIARSHGILSGYGNGP